MKRIIAFFMMFSVFMLGTVTCFAETEEKKEDELITKITLFLVVWAGVFTTTMGVAFPSIVIGVLGLLYGAYNKSIKSIFKHFLCCIPAICYGILYFIL